MSEWSIIGVHLDGARLSIPNVTVRNNVVAIGGTWLNERATVEVREVSVRLDRDRPVSYWQTQGCGPVVRMQKGVRKLSVRDKNIAVTTKQLDEWCPGWRTAVLDEMEAFAQKLVDQAQARLDAMRARRNGPCGN